MRNNSALLPCYCSTDRAVAAASVECEPYWRSVAAVTTMIVGAAMIINAMNYAMKFATAALVKFERHHSTSNAQVRCSFLLFASVFFCLLIRFASFVCSPLLCLLFVKTSNAQASEAARLYVGSMVNMGLVLTLAGAMSDQSFAWLRTILGAETNEDSQQYSDFANGWYGEIGTALVTTMLCNMVIPPLVPFLTWALSRVRRLTSRPSTQQQLNELMVGPEFRFDFRLASAFTTATIALVYGVGLPILFPIAALTFFITFWTDRAGLVFLYRSPGRISPMIVNQFVSTAPYLVFLHVAVGIWMLSSSELFGSVGRSPLGAPIYGLATAFGERTQTRLSRWHVVPLTVLLFLMLLNWLVDRCCARPTRPLRHAVRACMTKACCLLAKKADDTEITFSHGTHISLPPCASSPRSACSVLPTPPPTLTHVRAPPAHSVLFRPSSAPLRLHPPPTHTRTHALACSGGASPPRGCSDVQRASQPDIRAHVSYQRRVCREPPARAERLPHAGSRGRHGGRGVRHQPDHTAPSRDGVCRRPQQRQTEEHRCLTPSFVLGIPRKKVKISI